MLVSINYHYTMKILIVEDDERIALPLKEDLEHQHYVVQLACDGESGLNLGSEEEYDVILLDLMLPMMDGMTVCRKLRQSGCKAAIIIITARGKTANKISALDSGADDYLVKPFDVEELGARIRAVLRRGTEPLLPVLTFGKLSIDPSSCITTYKDLIVNLTPTEYRLLTQFLSNPHRAYSKEELINRLWSTESELAGGAIIKTHIKGLRKKLNAVGAPRDVIETVYGIGYRLKAHD